MVNNKPIAFFDSGVGQISVLREAKKLLPNESFVIFADQAHAPYGEKTRDQIQEYAIAATKFLIKKHKIKIMVLACNTATVLALDDLRTNFAIPFIGVVPAVKPAFAKSKNLRIAVMATPATASSVYLDNLIASFKGHSHVLKLGCFGLEEAIEELDWPRIDKVLSEYLKQISDFGADTVVLGCTHYPLVKSRIKSYLDGKVQIIDSTSAVAQRVKVVLKNLNLLASTKTTDTYYTTANPQKFAHVASILLKRKITANTVTF